MALDRKQPLINYLRVQERWERDLLYILNRAAADTQRAIRGLAPARNIGAVVRREQLEMTLRAIHHEQGRLWEKIGSSVKAGQAEAAAAGARTTFQYEEMLLRSGLSATEVASIRAAAEAQARQGVNAVLQRLQGASYVPLSDQVYKTQRLASGWVDRMVESQLVRGASWKEIADAVRASIRPDVRGGVAYAAKRLGRTELNNAFHASAVRRGMDSPFITGQRWTLSSSHPEPDECNDYAEQQHYPGGEAGVYKPRDVPFKPHPQCLCFLVPVTVSDEEFFRIISRQ